MLKRSFFLAFFVMSVHQICFSASQPMELKIGYFSLKPVSYTSNQVPKGAAIKLLQDVFKNLPEYRLTLVELPFNRLIADLKDGRIDGAVVLTDNTERRKLFLYPSVPFYKVRPGIALSKSFGLSSNIDPLTLPPIKLGIAENVNLSIKIDPSKVTLVRFNFVTSDSQSNSYAHLKAGRFDALYSPDVNDLKYGLTIYGLQNEFVAIALGVEEISQFTVFRKGLDTVLPAYERALKKQLNATRGAYLNYLEQAMSDD